MSKCIKVKLKARNGLMEIETPDGIVQGKKLSIAGLKRNKKDNGYTGFKMGFSFIEGRENEDLEIDLDCYYIEDTKNEVLIIHADGKKWKIPARKSVVFRNIVINLMCWNNPSSDWLELFKKENRNDLKIMLADRRVEFYPNSQNFCIIGEELKIVKNNFEYLFKVNTSDYTYNETLYIDGYYDDQEQVPVLLLETKDGRYRIPLYRPFYIYNVSINLKKIN